MIDVSSKLKPKNRLKIFGCALGAQEKGPKMRLFEASCHAFKTLIIACNMGKKGPKTSVSSRKVMDTIKQKRIDKQGFLAQKNPREQSLQEIPSWKVRPLEWCFWPPHSPRWAYTCVLLKPCLGHQKPDCKPFSP